MKLYDLIDRYFKHFLLFFHFPKLLCHLWHIYSENIHTFGKLFNFNSRNQDEKCILNFFKRKLEELFKEANTSVKEVKEKMEIFIAENKKIQKEFQTSIS
jgi:hypothetical protein